MKHLFVKILAAAWMVLLLFTGCHNPECTLTESETTAETTSFMETDQPTQDNDQTVYYGKGEIASEDIIRVPARVLEFPDESTPDKEKDTEEYTFEVRLPEGISQEPTGEDGALFYQESKLIGGYQVVHFEDSILLAVEENQERILTELREYMENQVDLSGFEGEITGQERITEERTITAFTNGEQMYSLFILSYGQLETQYVVWVDSSALEQSVVEEILWGTHLVITP